jgi:hypothetical protein
MQIGEVTFFASDIPFESLDPTGERLPDQILVRIDGYYLQPAGQDFRTCARTRLPSFQPKDAAELLYDDYRNGLVHEARLKNGCQFAIGVRQTIDTKGRFPVIDAERLLQEVRSSIHSLIEEMRADKEFQLQLATYIRHVFAAELARTQPAVLNDAMLLHDIR